jgi:hypothetical protein
VAPQSFVDGRILFAGVLAFALLVRVWVALDAQDAPYWTAQGLDGRVYLQRAQSMLAGTPPSQSAHYVAPGYTWLLGVVLASGGGVVSAKILNLVAGACSSALVAVLAWRYFGLGAALAAGLLWTVYPTALLQELLLHKSALHVLLVLACAVSVTGGTTAQPTPGAAMDDLRSRSAARSSRRKVATSGRWPAAELGRWAAAGLFMGLAVLLRPELLVASAILVVAALVARRRRWHGAPPPLALLLFILGLLGPVAVPTLQNIRRSGDLVVVAYGGGPNFYIGNHPGAHGGYEPLRADRSDALLEESDAVLLANTATGRTLSAAAVSRYWFGRGLAWWRTDPLAAVRLTAKKWGLLWGPQELPDGLSTRLAARWVAALRTGFVGPALVLPVSIVGLWLMRRRRELWPLYALILGLQIGIVPFFLFERFRLSLVALSLPFAAAAGAAGWQALRAREWFRLAAGVAAALAIGAVLAQARLPIQEAAHRAQLGSMLYEAARYQEAAQEYEAVRTAAPDYWRIDDNLAAAYAALRDYDRAKAAVDRFLHNLNDEEATTGLAPAEELAYGHELAGDLERIRDRMVVAETHYRAALRYAMPQDRARLRTKIEAVARLRSERDAAP